ncbi:MAG: YcgN family cysteine cluster protein [Rhodospirillales bacterium]|jgi:uncharacterized protein|nr:YcgN family cysteine cluster protein [Rhodospirillales bacterium]
MSNQPFWKITPLEAMSPTQWESLCDGCGKCCLGMVDDPQKPDALKHTSVACRLLDPHECRCSSYEDRHRFVPDCVRLTPTKIKTLSWLPSTCAYRLLSEGKDLPSWHPLVTGNSESVHNAGMSVRGRTVSEREVQQNGGDFTAYIADWPT